MLYFFMALLTIPYSKYSEGSPFRSWWFDVCIAIVIWIASGFVEAMGARVMEVMEDGATTGRQLVNSIWLANIRIGSRACHGWARFTPTFNFFDSKVLNIFGYILNFSPTDRTLGVSPFSMNALSHFYT